MKQARWIYLLKVLGLAAIYYAAARVGLSLGTVRGNVTLVWPAAGLGLAALVLYGKQLWPGIFLGTMLSTHTTDAPLPFILVASSGNAVAMLLASHLMVRAGRFRPALANIRDILTFLVLGIIPAATTSATLGTVGLSLAQMAPFDLLGDFWRLWWLGDAMGMLLVTPLILAWAKVPEQPWRGWRPFEIGFLIAAISAISYTVFMSAVAVPELIYLLFPLLIWIALRFTMLEATSGSLIASTIAAIGTVLGTSPLLRGTINESLLILWAYMGAITIVVLLLSAAMAQRREAGATHEGFLAQLRELEERDNVDDQAMARARAVQSTRLFSILTMVLVTAPFFLLSYESLQRLLSTRLTNWQSDVVTILSGSTLITVIAYLVLRRQAKLYEQILEEVLARRRVEEMRRELAEKARELQQTARALQAEVAERVQAEQTLQRSEERWRTYFEEANDFIFTLNAEGHVATVNQAARTALGYTSEELVGRSPIEFVAQIQRDRTRAALTEVLEGGQIPQVEVEAVTKDGNHLSLEVRGHAFYRDDQLVETFYIARDITQRKEAERALRESEERNRALLQAIPDLMFLLDENGIFLDYHVAENGLALPLPVEGFIGRRIHDVLPPEISGPLTQFFEHAFKTEKIQVYEFPLTVEGKVRHYEARLARCGRTQLLTIIRDITDRKEAEVSLLKEKAFSESILDTLPGVFALVNSGGNLLQWNQNLERTSGYRPEALAHFGVRDLFVDEDQIRVEQTLASIFKYGYAYIEANFVHKPDEQAVPHFFAGRQLVLDQQPYAILIGINIGDRKRTEEALRESEERYRMLFLHSPLGIFHFDETGTIIDCNDKFVEIVGSSRDTLAGFNMLAGMYDEGVPIAMRQALAGGIGYYEDDFRSVTGEKVTPVRALFSRITTREGKSLGGIGIIEDISERKRAEKVLQRKQKLESLGVLAGGVAHDFNNLLVAMMGQASLALTRLESGHPARDHVLKATKAAERAADLTRQLLAYSGRGQFETQTLQINTLIEENLHLFEVAIPKNVRLRPALARPLPLVEADPGQMQQVIMNLILNGAEAIGERPGSVTVSTTTEEICDDDHRMWHHGNQVLPGQYVVLTVSDDGDGMSEETLTKIFDPFFTTKFTGRGLGLAAVLGIVRGHKGGLQVESKLGEGTTFRVYLPAGPNESPENGAAPFPASTRLELGHILVIDDEEAVREAVFDILQMEGFPVLTASDGKSGLHLYRQRQDDIVLVVLDLSMPGMSGVKVLQELQNINPDIQVLLSSGYTEAEIAEQLENQGVAGFIQKPYTAVELVQVIRQVRLLER